MTDRHGEDVADFIAAQAVLLLGTAVIAASWCSPRMMSPKPAVLSR
jgi:hypothetical protein